MSAARRCDGCRHLCTDRAAVEAALPGVVALASVHASSWGANALCRRHARIVNGARRCAGFEPG